MSEAVELKLTLTHDGDTIAEHVIDGPDLWSFRTTVDRSMRYEDRIGVNHSMREVLRLATEGVTRHAEHCGRCDALAGLENQARRSASPLWRDSYDEGYAIGMSEKGGEA